MLKKKIFFIMAIVGSMMLSNALPVFAVSSVSNSYWKSKTYFSTGSKGSFRSKTGYGHVAGLPLNPYTSDFYTELNYRHFNQPNITAYSGIPYKSFSYKSSGSKTGGDSAWYYNSGSFWVWLPFTAYLSFDAYAKSASAGWERSGHGQYNRPWVSYGPDAYIYTYHY